jgi:hypothetical protein
MVCVCVCVCSMHWRLELITNMLSKAERKREIGINRRILKQNVRMDGVQQLV